MREPITLIECTELWVSEVILLGCKFVESIHRGEVQDFKIERPVDLLGNFEDAIIHRGGEKENGI